MTKKPRETFYIFGLSLFLFVLCFSASPLFAQTEVAIKSIEGSLFPFIYSNVSVKSNGTSVSDLTKDDFQVFENNELQTQYFEVTPPETSGGVRMADIVILIDCSGSMGSEIASVRNNVNNFANALAASDIDFRLGLVRFGYRSGPNPYLFNNGILTADVAVFQSFVNSLRASGGYEPGFLAVRQAILGFTFRPASQKIFLIITDEDSDIPRNKQETIDMLLANSVTVHAAARCSYGLSRGDYCDDSSIRAVTGGLLFGVWDSYESILETIAETTGSTYIVRYKASNPNFDGTLRTVEIFATANGETDSDTATYTPGSAPQITLTPETQSYLDPADPISLTEGTPLTISANVVDNIPPEAQQVLLYYKKTHIPGTLPTIYKYVNMLLETDNRWIYTIPGSDIQDPGLDFYIAASDGQLTSSNPMVDPADNPHQIAVLPNEAPVIEHQPHKIYFGSIGANLFIGARISDTTNMVNSSTLFYRKKGELIYQTQNNSQSGTSILFLEPIPGEFITGDVEIDYYIEAEDDFGLASKHGTPDNPHSFILLTNDGDWDEDGLTNSEEDQGLDGIISGDGNNNRVWGADELWTETDPLKADTDGDSLLDGWEVKGYYSNTDLYYNNPNNQAPDVDLSSSGYNALPLKKDIFVEIDWMEDDTHNFLRPRTEALEDIITAFSNAPVNNLNGSTGINLHLDYGQGDPNTEGGDHIEFVEIFNMGQDWSNFYTEIKDVYFLDQHRRRIFHYCVFLNKFNTKGNSGWSHGIPSNEFVVALGSWTGGTRQIQAGTFMHELGHNLGLAHGGDENTNFKPNYLSIMNYAFQLSGLLRGGNDGIMDYSRVALPTLNEACLNENNGLNGGVAIQGYGTKFYTDPGIADLFTGQEHFVENANDPINWNRDLDLLSHDSCVNRSINDSADYPDNNIQLLRGYNDWVNLIYSGRLGGRIGDSRGSIALEAKELNPEDELDFEAATKMLPYPPSGLSARALPSVVRLGWTPSNLEIVTHYNVYRKTDGADYQLISIAEHSIYDDVNVIPGVTYTYTVTSGDIYGNESVVLEEIQVAVPITTDRRR